MYLTIFDPSARDVQRRLNRRMRYATARSAAMPMDVVRREGDVLLRFDVPGIDPGSIDVTVNSGVLSVSATRQETRGESDRLVVRERRTGAFTRRLPLSRNLNADAIEASYANGVLEVRIPVLEHATPRKVQIQADGREELAS